MPDLLERDGAVSRSSAHPGRVGRPRNRNGRHRLRSWGIVRRLQTVLDGLPESVRGARVAPSRRAVGGLLVIGLAITAVLGLRLAMASAAARPAPVGPPVAITAAASTSSTLGVHATTGQASGTASSTPTPTVAMNASGSTPGPAAVSAGSLVVQVAGRVRRPGVRRLPTGSRVVDALRAAGGALPHSDLTSVNLAALVTDGEQVVIARTGSRSTSAAMTAADGGQPVAGAAAGSGAVQAPVDLNTADLAALDTLPGVGPVLAQRILDWRTAHGRFSSVDELQEVTGIGDKLLEQIRPHAQL